MDGWMDITDIMYELSCSFILWELGEHKNNDNNTLKKKWVCFLFTNVAEPVAVLWLAARGFEFEVRFVAFFLSWWMGFPNPSSKASGECCTISRERKIA